MKKLNSKGFGVVEGLLIFVIVGIIGGASYMVYKANKSTNDSLNATDNSEIAVQKQEQKAEEEAQKNPNEGYLVIKEWDVRLKFEDVGKVTYKIAASPFSQESATLFLKDQYSDVESCRNLGVGVARRTDNSLSNNKVGEYYYSINGGPGACMDDPGGASGSINMLRAELTSEKIPKAEFSAAE